MMNPYDFTFNEALHEYYLGERKLPGITTTLRENNLYTEWSYSEEFLRRGRLVHNATQCYDENDLEWANVPDHILGYVMAWERFRKETGYVPYPDGIEKKKFHPVLLFAGTPDRDGEFPGGRKALVEIKTTGDDGVMPFPKEHGFAREANLPPGTALQLSAQELLIGEPRERWGVELKPSGEYRTKHYRNHRDQNMFLAALALSAWRRDNGIIVRKKRD